MSRTTKSIEETTRTDKRQELENYFKSYPDVTREMIVKTDLLTHGIWFTPAAMDDFSKGRWVHKSYRLFSWDSLPLTDPRRSQQVRWPEEVKLKGGPYRLLPTVVQVRLNPEAAYVVDLVDGRPQVCIGGQPMADVMYYPRPAYYDLVFQDGTHYYDIAPLINWGTALFCTVYRFCQFDEKTCKFCDLNATLRGLRDLKQYSRTAKKVDQVAELARVIWEEEMETPKPLANINITAGALFKKTDGFSPADFFSRYVRAIREKAGTGPYIFLETIAMDKSEWKQWKSDGVNGVRPNIEVWGEEKFNAICPGKAETIGYKHWIQGLIDAAEVFGGSHVQPVFVCGAELYGEDGFAEVKDAIASTSKGIDALMSYGIIPRPIPWHREPNAKMANKPYPPMEYYIEVYRGFFESWLKYNLPVASAQGGWGAGITPLPHGCWGEVKYYHA